MLKGDGDQFQGLHNVGSKTPRTGKDLNILALSHASVPVDASWHTLRSIDGFSACCSYNCFV